MRFKKTILNNGLRVITVPMEENETVMVLVLVNTGTEFETRKTNGLSHFLEHMCFKGTKKRPSAAIIANELDSLGAENNAFTDREATGYYARGDRRHFKKLLDIVADIFLNSTFPPTEIEKEKGVIKGEIEMYLDLPQSVAYQKFLKILYGDTPGGWPTLGTIETISQFTQETFLNYHRRRYFAENSLLVVAGGISEKEVLKEAAEKFQNLPRGKVSKKENFEKKQKKPTFLFTEKKTDQTHLVLGVRAKNLFDKKAPVQNVLAALLGQGMSSRLFLKLRDEMGAGYYVRASSHKLTDRGFLSVEAGISNEKVPAAIAAILEEFRRLKTELVSEKELRKTKDFIIGHLKLSLETSDEVAEFFGFQEILGKPIETPKEVIAKIEKVTRQDLRRLAAEIFTTNRLNLSLVGAKRPDLAKIFRI